MSSSTPGSEQYIPPPREPLQFQPHAEIYRLHYPLITTLNDAPSSSQQLPKTPPPLVKRDIARTELEDIRKAKAAYNTALNFAKGYISSVFSTLFMLWMTGNSLQIFPLIMLCMSAFAPARAILSLNSSFQHYQTHTKTYAPMLFYPKFIYLALNSIALLACLWKANKMNLIPIEMLNYDPYSAAFNTQSPTLALTSVQHGFREIIHQQTEMTAFQRLFHFLAQFRIS